MHGTTIKIKNKKTIKITLHQCVNTIAVIEFYVVTSNLMAVWSELQICSGFDP